MLQRGGRPPTHVELAPSSRTPDKVAAYYIDLMVREGEAARALTADELQELRVKDRDHIEFE